MCQINSSRASTSDQLPVCGALVRKGLFGSEPCGQPAVAILDAGTPHGYPVCADCGRLCPPARLTRLDPPRVL